MRRRRVSPLVLLAVLCGEALVVSVALDVSAEKAVELVTSANGGLA